MSSRRIQRRGPAAVDGNATVDEQRLNNLLDELKVGVAYLSAAGRIVYCNRSFAELLGWLRQDAVGRNLKSFIDHSSWHSLAEALRNAASDSVEGELRIDCEAETRFLRLNMGPLEHSPFDGAKIHASAVETTEVVNASAAVAQRENSLRSLAGRILEVQDQERRRIARDLHDVTGQEIAAISMALGSLLKRSQASGPEAAKELSDSMKLLHKVEEEIRTLSYVLHPPLLDERGLASALDWYVDGFRKRSGIEVQVRVPRNSVRLPIEQEIALFRVVQEGLTNVLRHSESAKAEISLSITETEVELAVYDEGVGISPQKLALAESSSAGSEFGVGIPGMRERIGQLGGSLELQSRESGTRLVARLPRGRSKCGPARHEPLPRVDAAHALQAIVESLPRRQRILIADDHEVVRHGIRTLLSHQPEWEICGEAGNGFEAVSKTKELRPDLVLLDLTMPGIGGLTAAQRIRAAGVKTKLLVFTTHDYPGLDRVIQGAGCNGYVPKARASEDLVSSIKAVLQGKSFYPPSTFQEVMAQGGQR